MSDQFGPRLDPGERPPPASLGNRRDCWTGCVALTRAPRVCGQPGCVGVPVFNRPLPGARGLAEWERGACERVGDEPVEGAADAERGERCEHPSADHAGPIELNHLGGVEDNRPDALELRCRKHNPRGAPTHKR